MNLKFITSALAGLLLATVAFAGNEDWQGVFNFRDPQGNIQLIKHEPNRVSFMFFAAGSCLKLGERSVFNGLRIPTDVEFCTHANIADFTKEVEKLGPILNKEIIRGPSYQDQ